MQSTRHGPLPPGNERRVFLVSQPTYWLKRCYQTLRRTVDHQLRAYGVTLSQRDVLLALWDEGPLDQRALRDRLGLEQSTVSRLVEGLVRRELVELSAAEDDRRVRIATLTESGRELLRQTPGAAELGGLSMLAGLSAAEQAELVRLLRHCAGNLMDRLLEVPLDEVAQPHHDEAGAIPVRFARHCHTSQSRSLPGHTNQEETSP